MNNWQKFWNGLNIRKALSLLFGLAMIIGSLTIVFYGITQNPVDKDILIYGLTGLTGVTTTLIGYYFGYSNGVNNTDSKDPNDSL